MPPKRSSKLKSVMESWAQQQVAERGRQDRKRPFQPGEIVDLSSSQEDVSAPQPWQPSTSSYFPPAANRPSRIEYTSERELRACGYNTEAGKFIAYPIDEFIRPYEKFFLKKCLSMNTCVSLPLGVSPVQIIVLTFHNLLRWFSISPLFYCCNSMEIAEAFKTICISMGIHEKKITIIPTFMHFKKKNIELGNIIISTPQCFQKIVESESSLLPDLRCVAISLEPNEALNKYKFVGLLVAKGLKFRVLITMPSFPDGSRRASSISKRQQMITSLFISDWEEPRSTDPAFRLSAIPNGLHKIYWSDTTIIGKHSDLLRVWKEGFAMFIKDFPQELSLPSQVITQLLNVDWKEMQKKAAMISPEVSKTWNILAFIVTAYGQLLLFGARVFYLYSAAILNNLTNNSLSEQIQETILTNENLSEVSYKIQAEYAYNTDSVANTTFNPKSLNSHPKYSMLISEIENYIKQGVVKGVILCETLHVSRAVAESIRSIPNCKVVVGVPSATQILPQHQNYARHTNRLSGLFFEPRSTILILNLEDEATFAALDTASSNNLTFIISMGRRSICLAEFHTGDFSVILNEDYERLRESDGRIVQEAAEPPNKRWSTGAVGAVNKYSFKFEPSRLAIDLSQVTTKYVLNLEDSQENRRDSSPIRHSTPVSSRKPNIREMLAKNVIRQRSPKIQETKKIQETGPLPEIGKYRRNQLKIIDPTSSPKITSAEEISWNQRSGQFGKVPRSSLTQRFLKYISSGEPILPSSKIYEYENLEDNQLIGKYNLILDKIDQLLTM